jgi:hypothetical protein
MFTYDLIHLSKIRHEELIAEADQWSGRAYGFYRELDAQPQRPQSRIAASISFLKALFARKPAQGVRTLSTAAK